MLVSGILEIARIGQMTFTMERLPKLLLLGLGKAVENENSRTSTQRCGRLLHNSSQMQRFATNAQMLTFGEPCKSSLETERVVEGIGAKQSMTEYTSPTRATNIDRHS